MFWKIFYNLIAIPIIFVGFRIAGVFDRKIREGIAGRRQVFQRLKKQLNLLKSTEKKIWFHVTSVGEFEQAKPVIESIGDNVEVVITYFSPSVQSAVESYENCVASAYLPIDTPRNAKLLLELIQPSLLIFSKFDIWPNLVWKSSKGKIPTVLMAGTLQPKSKRIKPFVRSFFKSVHKFIDLHCVISEADANRFRTICPKSAPIEITGDTRFDRVHKVAQEAFDFSFPGDKTFKHPILVAGSTYSEDEVILLNSLKTLHTSGEAFHLILVPHEPTSDRIREIELLLDKLKFSSVKFSELHDNSDLSQIDLLLVDRVGFLAKLYKFSDVAFVGGSFARSVHNVIEPAVLSKAIVLGPVIHNSHEAKLLVDRGAAVIVHNSEEMMTLLQKWLRSVEMRKSIGEIGKKVVAENLGATAKTVALIKSYEA